LPRLPDENVLHAWTSSAQPTSTALAAVRCRTDRFTAVSEWNGRVDYAHPGEAINAARIESDKRRHAARTAGQHTRRIYTSVQERPGATRATVRWRALRGASGRAAQAVWNLRQSGSSAWRWRQPPARTFSSTH